MNVIWNNERPNPQGNCDLQTQQKRRKNFYHFHPELDYFFSSIDGVGYGFVVPFEMDGGVWILRTGERKGLQTKTGER
ncbi:hypothetical protein EV1_032746 [Malus domestica]